MNIRSASMDDAPAIAAVHVASWQISYRGIIADSILDSLSVEERTKNWHDRIAQTASENTSIFVAEESGQIVGFCVVGPNREDIPGYPGELYAIYLLKEYQQRHIGRALVKTGAQELLSRGLTAMVIWVLSDNPAKKFYEALGGKYIREKNVNIRGQNLLETAYGWEDIHSLI